MLVQTLVYSNEFDGRAYQALPDFDIYNHWQCPKCKSKEYTDHYEPYLKSGEFYTAFGHLSSLMVIRRTCKCGFADTMMHPADYKAPSTDPNEEPYSEAFQVGDIKYYVKGQVAPDDIELLGSFLGEAEYGIIKYLGQCFEHFEKLGKWGLN